VVDDMSAQQQIAHLSARLEEAEETLRAVSAGEIDAFIVQGPRGEQVYSLRNVEQPYRTLVEEMQEGAAILTCAGDIVYCNRQFSILVAIPLEDVIGRPHSISGLEKNRRRQVPRTADSSERACHRRLPVPFSHQV
jgi:PAS domain-containing protein